MTEISDNYDARVEAAVEEVVAVAYSLGARPGSVGFKRLVKNFAKAYDVRSTDVAQQAEELLT